MRQKWVTALTLAIIAVLTQAVTLAFDTVYLRSGGTQAGTIEKVTKDNVIVKVTKGTKTVPTSEIKDIAFTGQPSRLRIAQGAEKAGHLDRALAGYKDAQNEYKGNNANITKELLFLIARTTAKMAEADPSKLSDAITKLEAYRSGHSTSFRYYDALILLGKTYTDQKNYAKARDTYSLLAASTANSYRMTAQNAQARLLMKENKTSEALAEYTKVAAVTPETPGEQACKFEALLGTAACQQAEKNYDLAIKTLNDVILQVSADESRVQAEAYIRQGDCYRAQMKFKAAALAYLHVDVLYSTEKELHAQSLYWLSQMWNMTDPKHPERAQEAQNKLAVEYPGVDWKKKLEPGG